MTQKIIILSLLLITLMTGQDHSGYAGNYFNNGTDARSIAMGNALTAGTNSSFPAYFNPAGVASTSNRKLLFTNQFLSLDRSQSIISFTAPLPPIGGISIGWIRAGVNDIDGRDLVGNHTDYLNASENAFLISFGIAPAKHIQLGGTVKILQNQLPNIDGNINGNGVGFDLGVIYNVNTNINFALVVKDINSAYQWSNKLTDDLGRVYKDKFPIQIRSGVQYKISSLIVVGDIGSYLIDSELLDLDYRIGTEYSLNNYFFRFGFRNDRLSFGAGLNYKQFEKFSSLIDYAVVIEPVASLTHIISYAIIF